MKAMRFEAVDIDGGWRPMLPPGAVKVTYWSLPGPERHDFSLRALVDTGSTHIVLQRAMLPLDVPWEGLRRITQKSSLSAGEPAETRIWRATVDVCGYTIADDVHVMDSARSPGYIILGNPLLERFMVGFAFSSRPRTFDIAPVGQVHAGAAIEILRAPDPLRVGGGRLQIAQPLNRHDRRRAAKAGR